jgi:hypothetical protein
MSDGRRWRLLGLLLPYFVGTTLQLSFARFCPFPIVIIVVVVVIPVVSCGAIKFIKWNRKMRNIPIAPRDVSDISWAFFSYSPSSVIVAVVTCWPVVFVIIILAIRVVVLVSKNGIERNGEEKTYLEVFLSHSLCCVIASLLFVLRNRDL